MSVRIMAFDHEPYHLLLYKTVLSKHDDYHVFCYDHDWLDFNELEAVQPDLLIWGNVYGFDNRELDVVEEIRNHPGTQDLPVLLVTTVSKFSLDIHRLRTLGKLYMLTKPFDAQQLLDVVQKALGASHPTNTD